MIKKLAIVLLGKWVRGDEWMMKRRKPETNKEPDEEPQQADQAC